MSVELVIIVPVFNEAANILPLAQEVAVALSERPGGYELLFVDDASTDDTWDEVASARAGDSRVRGVRHTRNAGQSAALWTGIQHSVSPLIGTLDGDLQNDPADLPRMLSVLAENDLVCGLRAKRQDSWVRRMSSRVARMARQRALGSSLADTGCGIRVFRRSALAGIFGFNGLHRFLPILVESSGGRVREIDVNHRARVAGVSKYGIGNRLWRGLADLYGVAWYQKRRLPVQKTVCLPGE